MRLLSKSEALTQKVKEKSVEIQEGLKLAQKIDILRETVAKEQSNLEKFRVESLKTIKAEIDSLIEKRSVIKQEVLILEEEKNRLKIIIESISRL